jgi:menaquinone-9 beta-reductase
MRAARPITIIGGGLAGLTLGIGLRQRGIPVLIREAGTYPRHRVCGEFISGRGQEILTSLGLAKVLFDAGAIHGRSVKFFMGRGASPSWELAESAWCLSRFVLDAVLARHFRECGGELRENARVREVRCGEGVVRASGRRAQPVEDGWRWFGLKVHGRGASLEADLEMHSQPAGYVGVCRLPAGEVNICGLFRRPVKGTQTAPDWRDLLAGARGTPLREHLANAIFDDESFCSVAALPLVPQNVLGRTECCLGDALTMVPPVTGNGMSMAFESAQLAIGPLAAWSRGELTWEQSQRRISEACHRAFGRRLRWAKWLQWMMFAPTPVQWLGAFAFRCRGARTLLVNRTR